MRPAALVLGSEAISSLLDEDACRAAVEDAFRLHGLGEAPAPGVLGVPASGGGFHVKAGVLRRGPRTYFAAKVNGNFSGNERLGLPRIQGVVVLADAGTGTPLALLDSAPITALRTAAATAVAAQRLARRDSRTATIVGCGTQGRAQLRALARVLPLRTAFAFDQDVERATRFVESFSSTERRSTGDGKTEVSSKERGCGGITVRVAAGLREALAESDVCVTCTPSKEPLLFASLVRRGTFVSAVGADAEDKQEIDASLMAAARVVTDVTAQCAAFGDLHHAIASRAMSAGDVHAELGEIVAGKKPGRTDDDETIVFDSTGMALQDVAAAAAAFEAAERAGRGLTVELFS